jgi:nucleotide-binding universal stress UspA family protein
MTFLAPTDFSDQSRASVRMASRLAVRRETDLVLLHCLESAVEDTSWRHLLEVPDNMRAHFWRAAKRRLEAFFEEAVPIDARPREVEYRVELAFAEDGIRDDIEEFDPDMVVMAPTGKGRIAGALLGSTTERIVRGSSAPVMVVPEGIDLETFDRILAPVDFTGCSERSLQMALALAREYGAHLSILHAYDLPVGETPLFPSRLSAETLEDFEQREESSLETFLDHFDLEGVECTEQLRVGVPHRTIREVADEENSDLVVMGTHGRRGFERLFLGSTTSKMLRDPPCPLLTLRSTHGT